MKDVIELAKAVVQLASLVCVVAAVVTFVALPDFFARRLGLVLVALDREEITARVSVLGLQAELNRVSEELTEADARTLTAMRQAAASGDAPQQSGDAPGGGADGDGAPHPPTPQDVVSGPDRWVVIAGAERDLPGQRREAERLQAAGFDPVILQSGEWYQAAVIFDGREAAEAALPEITEAVGEIRAPYIRSLSVWCVERAPVAAQSGLLRCGG